MTTLAAMAPQSLLTSGETTVTINGTALADGVRLSGSSTGVEPGQPITVSLLGADAAVTPQPITTFHAVHVQADGSWTVDLTREALQAALQDRSDYIVMAEVSDSAGNRAVANPLALLSRLSASIDVVKVIANNRQASGLDGAVLNFDSSPTSSDPYINAADKTVGTRNTGDPTTTGFTVSGTSTIGTGRVVTVQLVKAGSTSLTGSGGVVNSSGQWSVVFSRGMVGDLTDGTWQLVAQGSDAYGNDAALSAGSSHSFTVDTQASLELNAVGNADRHVNLTQTGATLTLSGRFDFIDAVSSVTLSLRDRNAANTNLVIWSEVIPAQDLQTDSNGHWHYDLALSAWDALAFEHAAGASWSDVASLSLTASTTDRAGNKAADIAFFELDRIPPAAPVEGSALRQIAGGTLEIGSTTHLNSATTLQDSALGVFLAPNAPIPANGDIAGITVIATQAHAETDQWRLGGLLQPLHLPLSATSYAIGTGASAVTVVCSFDTVSQQLIIKPNSGTFTPTQVQTVLSSLAWVNITPDSFLDQSDRVFTVRFTDALGNASVDTPITFRVDTRAPTSLSGITVTAAVTGTAADGTVVDNTLNGTNSALKFVATIGAGEATGGYAEFYVGTALVGRSSPIAAADSTISYTTQDGNGITGTPAALQAKVATGGVVTVKLYDKAGNVLSANGPTLTRDLDAPTITKISSSAADGSYKAGATIALSLWTDEDIAGEGSLLDVTLAMGAADPAGVSDRVITLVRDVVNPKLFSGWYTVQPGDNTLDLSVSQVAGSSVLGAVLPQDAAGNALNLSIASLVAADTLSGSRDIVIDTTPPVAIDLVSGGVVNITQSQYVSAARAGIDTDVMGSVDRVSDHDVSTITLALLGADGLNDVLTFGGVSLSLNATARSGTVSTGRVMADWAYSAAGVLTFTLPNGGVWNPEDIQALESSLKFKTYQAAQMGVRSFTLTHGDRAGNTSVGSTQSLIVDMVAPQAPDLNAFNVGIQRIGTTYYGLADVGRNITIAPQADASQDDITQIVITVGGVVSSADQWVMGGVTQSLSPSASVGGTHLSINGVSGVDWTYTTDKVLTLTRNGGGTWTATQVRDIERGLSFNTTAGAPAGARTFTLQTIDAAGNASAASIQTLVSDLTAPTINAVAITGVTPAGAPKSILGVGDQVRVELTLSEGVVVDTSLGIPSYRVVLDTGGTVSAAYVSGSGTNTLVFSYTVAPTNSDSSGGIVPAASPLNWNGATVLDLAGNACSIASLPPPAVNTLRVDTAAPASVSSMVVLDTTMPASTNATVKVLNSSLFQVMSARGVHYGFNNTSAVTISYRQDDGSSLSFSFTDKTTYTGLSGIKSAATTAFTNSTLGQAGLFDFSIDGASGTGYSSNSSSSPASSGDGVARMMWMYFQAKPGKVVDASRLTFSNSFFYWLPSSASANNPGATAVTYDTAVGWGSNTPAVPGNASVNTGQGMSTTQIAVGGHINSGSTLANGWLYHYQGLTRSTPTSEPVVDTVADNRLVFDFSASGGIAKSTVLSTVTAGEGRLSAADALTVLNLWRSKFTAASGALPTFAELFGAATSFNGSAQEITSTGGEGYMVSYQYLTGSSSLVGKLIIDLGATSMKSKLLGGKFTFGSGSTATVLKLPTAWANDGGTQIDAVPTFDITLPAGVEEGSVITLYDGTTSNGTMIGTKFLTANEVTRGFASLSVSPDTPFANTSSGVVVHNLSAKVTDNAGNVSTNDSFYNYAFQDNTGPKVRAVKVWGTTAAGTVKTAPLVAGDQLKVTLVWDEIPVVTGVPTYSLNINGVTQTATYQGTSGKDMLLSYTVGDNDSSVGVTATTIALSLTNGATIQDASGNVASLTTPVVAAIDSSVILANPRGELHAAQAQALAMGASQPVFALSYDGSRAQVGDRLVLMENGVCVGSRVLTSSDVGAGSYTLNVTTDSSLVSGTHAITFQYLDNTGAGTTYTVNGSPVTEYVSVEAHPTAPVLTLDAIRLNNEGGQAGRTVADWSTYQSTSDPDLVFGGTVDQDATVTVYATSNTTGAVQTVGTQSVLANGTFSISEVAFSLAPDVYQFKVVAQNTAGHVASEFTGSVGVFATSTVGDTIVGTAGNDTINAGEGTNTVSTGSGLDLVYLGGYRALASNTGPSSTTITDFKLGQDKIDLTGVFTPGTVNSSNFMQFVSQSFSNGDTTLTIDSNGLGVAGGTTHTVILQNLAQLPLDSTVFNYAVL